VFVSFEGLSMTHPTTPLDIYYDTTMGRRAGIFAHLAFGREVFAKQGKINFGMPPHPPPQDQRDLWLPPAHRRNENLPGENRVGELP
jgi:hypothetical protein